MRVYPFFKLHNKRFSLNILSADNVKRHSCCKQKLSNTRNYNRNLLDQFIFKDDFQQEA